MPYNKSKKNIGPYVRPPRTRKFEPCDCRVCKGKLVDPRTKASHAKKRIIPQREITTNLFEIPRPPPTLENFMDINYNEDKS